MHRRELLEAVSLAAALLAGTSLSAVAAPGAKKGNEKGETHEQEEREHHKREKENHETEEREEGKREKENHETEEREEGKHENENHETEEREKGIRT